jgi:hypothetical protein
VWWYIRCFSIITNWFLIIIISVASGCDVC